MKSTKLSLLMNAALGLTLGALPMVGHAVALDGTMIINAATADVNGAYAFGAYFVMQANNPNSPSVAWLSPGTAGGIVLGTYQNFVTNPNAVHLANWDGLGAGAGTGYLGLTTQPPILAPFPFFGTLTYVGTNPVGYSSGTAHPVASADFSACVGNSCTLTLELSAWEVFWNGSAFEQGPRPSNVGPFVSAVGTYDQVTRAYSVTWKSQIKGGPFNSINGFWHLDGFVICGTCAGLMSSTPANGVAGLDAPTITSYSVTFNEAINPATITSAFLAVSGGVTVGNPTPSAGNKVFTFPLTGVAGNITYSVTPNPAGALAVSGHPLATGGARFFTTFADNILPTVTSVIPADGAIGVPPDWSGITVNFSEPVIKVTAGSISVDGGVTVGTPTGSNSNRTWSFPITSGTMNKLTKYSITFNAGITDPSSNPLTIPALAKTFNTSAFKVDPLSAATKDKLLICPGSNFGMEVSKGKIISTSVDQQNPITIGVAQPGAGGGHSGAPSGGEATVIDKAWNFFGNTGLHFTETPITQTKIGLLNFEGWRVAWNNVPTINMGSGQPATFEWNGVYGDPYKLTYYADVPLGDPSGFGGVPYSLNLVGTVAGGPNNVVGTCAVIVKTPSAVQLSSDIGNMALNSQIRPDDTLLIAAGYSAKGRPDNLDFYKYGLITYTVSGLAEQGKSVKVTLILPADLPAGSRFYKVGPAGYTDITDKVIPDPSAPLRKFNLNIVDDGELDSCKKCLDENGKFMIIDPIAIGIPFATGTSGDPSGGKGGGCAYNPAGKFDPMLPMLLLSGLGYFGWKRARAKGGANQR